MRLPIDTHALIWFCDGNPALGSAARSAMEDESNERFISHAVPWEMALKVSLGKLSLQTDYDVIFPGVCDANGFQMLTPTVEHYRGVTALPTSEIIANLKGEAWSPAKARHSAIPVERSAFISARRWPCPFSCTQNLPSWARFD